MIAAPPSAGQLGRRFVLAAFQVRHVDDVLHPLFEPLAVQPIAAPVEQQVFLDAEVVVEREFLRHVPQACADAERLLTDVVTQHERRS
jgi:hypothetical protein